MKGRAVSRTIQLGSISSLRCQKSRKTRSGESGECGTMFSRTNDREPIGDQTIWWSQTGSNRRPHACKARALPAELWPRNQKTNALHSIKMVGLERFELSTSRLSSARSNQLSYRPGKRGGRPSEERETEAAVSRKWGFDEPHVFLSAGKERNCLSFHPCFLASLERR